MNVAKDTVKGIAGAVVTGLLVYGALFTAAGEAASKAMKR